MFLQQYVLYTTNITAISIYGTTAIVWVRYTFYSENVFVKTFSHFSFFFYFANKLPVSNPFNSSIRHVTSRRSHSKDEWSAEIIISSWNRVLNCIPWLITDTFIVLCKSNDAWDATRIYAFISVSRYDRHRWSLII